MTFLIIFGALCIALVWGVAWYINKIRKDLFG